MGAAVVPAARWMALALLAPRAAAIHMSAGASGAGAGEPAVLGIALATDRAIYAPGDTMAVRLTISNRGGPAVTLHFASAQRYDFEIQDRQGATLWRWAADRVFAQVLGEERLGQDRSEVVFREHLPAPQTPGTYRVVARLVASDRPMAATVAVTVRGADGHEPAE